MAATKAPTFDNFDSNATNHILLWSNNSFGVGIQGTADRSLTGDASFNQNFLFIGNSGLPGKVNYNSFSTESANGFRFSGFTGLAVGVNNVENAVSVLQLSITDNFSTVYTIPATAATLSTGGFVNFLFANASPSPFDVDARAVTALSIQHNNSIAVSVGIRGNFLNNSVADTQTFEAITNIANNNVDNFVEPGSVVDRRAVWFQYSAFPGSPIFARYRSLTSSDTIPMNSGTAVFEPSSKTTYDAVQGQSLTLTGFSRFRFNPAPATPSNMSLELESTTSTFYSIVGTTGSLDFPFAGALPAPYVPGVDAPIARFTLQNTSASVSQSFGVGGADPHFVCLDGSRMEVYHDGVFRLFEYRDNDSGVVVVNGRVAEGSLEEVWIFSSATRMSTRIKMADRRDINAEALEVETMGDDDGSEIMADPVVVLEDFSSAGDSTKAPPRPRRAVVTVGRFRFTVEASYCAFGVELLDDPEEITAGGVLAAVVGPEAPSSLEDTAPGPSRTFRPGYWGAHALACDAGSPHLVTLHGALRLPSRKEEELLLRLCDGTEIRASFDDKNRIVAIRSTDKDGATISSATWERDGGAAPARESEGYVAPSTTLTVKDSAGNVVERISEHGTRGELTRGVDLVVSFSCCPESENQVLIRLQANGTASFALRSTADIGTMSGVLTEKDPNALGDKQASPPSMALYERSVEPHLVRASFSSVARENSLTCGRAGFEA